MENEKTGPEVWKPELDELIGHLHVLQQGRPVNRVEEDISHCILFRKNKVLWLDEQTSQGHITVREVDIYSDSPMDPGCYWEEVPEEELKNQRKAVMNEEGLDKEEGIVLQECPSKLIVNNFIKGAIRIEFEDVAQNREYVVVVLKTADDEYRVALQTAHTKPSSKIVFGLQDFMSFSSKKLEGHNYEALTTVKAALAEASY